MKALNSNQSQWLEKAVRMLKGIIFVPKCSGCGVALPLSRTDEAGGLFCDRCLSRFEKAKLKRCPECNQASTECSCSPRIMREMGFGVMISLVPYSEDEPTLEVVRRVLFRIKNTNDRALIDYLAKQLCYRIFPLVYELGGENVIVTFAPRSRGAVNEIGHDQAALLSKRLAHHLGVRWSRLISRTRMSGVKQKDLGAEERLKNAKASFVPSGKVSDVKGK